MVYTKQWVVDLILDLAGYTCDQKLFEKVLIEPAAGDGAFLVSIVERLIASCRAHQFPLLACRDSLRAFELNAESARASKAAVSGVLQNHGVSGSEARELADSWILRADYLLDSSDWIGKADLVVGNPPYIRLEDLEDGGAMYRKSYPTMVGRADIYVAFFEAALRHLKADGVCAFICADRWMFNQYGAELRRYVSSRFSVEAVIQMHRADAFQTEVSAYPAITLIRNSRQREALLATIGPGAECLGGAALAQKLRHVNTEGECSLPIMQASVSSSWFSGSEPWSLQSPKKLALLRKLEQGFATLEETGAIVGIGVATGADRIYITQDESLVETDRLLPLAMASDLKKGRLDWSGKYLVDPWDTTGLVDLQKFPKLNAYLEEHKKTLQNRHVGKKSASSWFRTIDRVSHSLTGKSKLYFPDIKGRIAPVLDQGETYPHHNLYYITADGWDMKVLGGLLISNVAQFFVEAYGVRMRGGYLRFQAQYLRRIRVPRPSSISEDQEMLLRRAFESHDFPLANRVAAELYGLTDEEGALLGY